MVEGEDTLDLAALLHSVRDASYSTQEVTEKTILPVTAGSAMWNASFAFDWWLDEFQEKAVSLKCWAGQVTTKRLFEELPKLVLADASPEELFRASAPTTSRFGVDPRSAWNALDFGSSPNTQGRDATTFPAVEMLAVFGLQSFRPQVSSREEVLYYLWTEPLPLVAASLAAADRIDGIASTCLCFSIAKRGQSYKYFTYARPVPERTTL